MTAVNILKVNSLKVYFPYLDDKAEHSHSLRSEMVWLLTYTLFSDCVICPPRSFFGAPHGIDNLAAIYGSRLLRELVESGVIISTATTDKVRDVGDLIERYSGVHPKKPIELGMPIYLRSEPYQRNVSSDYMLNFIDSVDEIPRAMTEHLRKEFLGRPDATQTNRILRTIELELPPPVYAAISRETANSYFFAGAVGNGAIMPPPTIGANSHIYNYMYSKKALAPFLIKTQQILKSSLLSVSPAQFLALRKNLDIFRHMYAELSNRCIAHYGEIISLLTRKYAFSNVNAPIVIAQSLTATAIALATGYFFAAAAASVVGLYFIGKLSWETFSKALKINDRISAHLLKVLGKMGVLSEHQREVSEIMARFESSVVACIPR